MTEYRHPTLFRCGGCAFECKLLINRSQDDDRFTPSVCNFPPNDVGDFDHPRWRKIAVEYEQTPEIDTDEQFKGYCNQIPANICIGDRKYCEEIADEEAADDAIKARKERDP